jgi:Brp/Blh family beta-carotene 15,15'-monooxygenase
LHFGFGDSAFKSEWIESRGANKDGFLKVCAYALPAGFLPVTLPLTDSRALSALNRINPEIANWSGSINQTLRNIVLALALIGLFLLLINRNFQASLDLLLLVILSLLAPPLIAFAVYFGCWHAMRHTARLTLTLPSSQAAFAQGSAGKAFMRAVLPGTPALVGTFVVAALIVILRGDSLDDQFLWVSLVVVWALTVPHMAVTARLDRKALS